MTSVPKKKLLTVDYEIHSSIKILYPYINSAGGLSEWFADDVRINQDKSFIFMWDNEPHKANLVNYKINHYTKFEYLPVDKEDTKDPSYFELRLEVNELTQTTFLKITDYSEFDDIEEQEEVWKGLVDKLKSVVGR